MLESEILLEVPGSVARADPAPVRLPAPPKTVRDTGLDQRMLIDLVAKSVSQLGKAHLPVLGGQLRLPVGVLREVLDAMQAERLVETTWRGETDLDIQYQLTMGGKQHAAECLARCRYTGPAPVTLSSYGELLERQSARGVADERLGAAEIEAAFADDFLARSVRDLIGAAMHAGRSLLLHGAPGSGKTTLARKLGRLQKGVIAVPYALVVEHQIVQLYDPAIHLAPSPVQARLLGERRAVDSRWAMCRRPVVLVGAQLDADTLEMRRDDVSGVLHAPAQMQANGGMLVVDDLGSQRGSPGDIVARLACARAAGFDQVVMHGSHKLNIPFDAMTVFATNRDPRTLLDEAQMRRIDYKVHVGALGEPGYRQLFRQQCRVLGLACDEAALDHLVGSLHARTRKPMLASYPRELIARIAEFASYAGAEPRLTAAALDQAWSSMFAATTSAEV
ncbi:MAG TPA: ATP-binding protein [Telluria sp.]|nr:ATP-binding protein [Telluria sp.]